MTNKLPHTLRTALSPAFFLLLSAPALAAEPSVRNLNVRGLQIGGTTTITIDGDDLGKAPKLFLPFPAKQTLKPGNTEKQATFEIALENTVTPGLYHLRLLTDQGMSLPIVIGVDRLMHKPLAAVIDAIPAAIYGNLGGSTVVETTFEGKAGENFVVEVEAQRLGSKLRPVVHLVGPKKLQVAWGWGMSALQGDARLAATLPETGTYTIAVHDAEYAGAAPGFFRMKVGAFGYVDQVFPPVAGKETRSFELLGSKIDRVDLPISKTPSPPAPLPEGEGRDWVVLPWPKELTLPTGPRPWAPVSRIRELVAPDAPGKPMEVPAGPIAVSGKLTQAHEERQFRVAVEPKSKVRFEVFAERIGSPLDTSLVIRNEMGGVLAQVEDSPGTLDPALEYTAPDKVTAVTVGVIDSGGRSSPHGIFRLVVEPVKPEGAGDIHVFTFTQRLALASGARMVVPVFVDRRGYFGPLALAADNLPPGVTLDGLAIPPGADGTLVTIAGTVPTAAISHWKARTERSDVLAVFVKGHPLERLQPWLATEIAVAPTSLKATDFAIDWRALPADAGLSPGGKLTLPITVKRLDPAAPVRFTVLTSQNPPLTNNQPDPNRTLRLERPIELAAKAADSDLPLVIPPELPADAYQIAVEAELLSPDKQRVLATAVTPVRTLKVKLPVALKLEGAPRIEAKLDAKAATAVEVKGLVERINGFTGDVSVTLAGLPPGVAVPAPITVKAADVKFAFKLSLPPNAMPAEAKLKVSASAVPDPKQPNVRVASRDVEAILVIRPAAK